LNCGNIIGVKANDKIKMKIIISCLFLLILVMPKVAFGAEKIKRDGKPRISNRQPGCHRNVVVWLFYFSLL